MYIEVDTTGVDQDVVDELVELMFDAIINAEHIDPTMEEGVVAIGKLLSLIVEDEGVSVPMH
jgi:transcription elongation GreA/GreB family factor